MLKQSARVDSLSPQRNLNFQQKNEVLSKECGMKWGCAAATPVANRRSDAIRSRETVGRSCYECDWLAQYLLPTVHSYSLIYFLLFCEAKPMIKFAKLWKENEEPYCENCWQCLKKMTKVPLSRRPPWRRCPETQTYNVIKTDEQ